VGWFAVACSDDSATAVAGDASSDGETSSPGGGDSSGVASASTGPTGPVDPDSSSGSDPTSPIYDVGGTPDVGIDDRPTDVCRVVDDMDALGNCDIEAPPDSFEPDIQWAWLGDGDELYSTVIPLVANLTDDNGDGSIDLCDVPDVVVVAYAGGGDLHGPGHLHVLDGATGNPHFRVDTVIARAVTPALGDIDGDGLIEIVTVRTDGNLVAFEHDGTLAWTGTVPWVGFQGAAALALADLDNDGDVEIFGGDSVYDHEGELVVQIDDPVLWDFSTTTTAADLDDDGDLEIVLGHAAYHHDGSPLWITDVGSGQPQVANLDDDPEPEVLVGTFDGVALLDHDGAVQYQELLPTGDLGHNWITPAAVHDFDGTGDAEYAMNSGAHYSVFEPDGSIVWSAMVADTSGAAGGTAFDFLGDGTAEAMFADETQLFVFGGAGEVLLQADRFSWTLKEYPVVADIDNDGSAEILVVSNEGLFGGGVQPLLQAIRDVDDRWIQARRIWNQHTYHVTNVREDGTIPQVEPHHWERLNTFRTNAQIEGGVVCMPEPAG
jgi:hypothetical protein